MLNLHAPTPKRWLDQVRPALDELLIDHAHCEKKAAGVALNFLFSYPEQVTIARDLAEIVQEEITHFTLVLDLLQRRQIPFRKLHPGGYGRKLAELAAHEEPMKAVDRMLIAALIEARSCERFALLRDNLDDEELSDFFGSLFESEARHHATYVRLAKEFAAETTVRERLKILAEEEAKIIVIGDNLPRMHS
jgi:tRNA-(ms[2]io[6]A)-hydroxylase